MHESGELYNDNLQVRSCLFCSTAHCFLMFEVVYLNKLLTFVENCVHISAIQLSAAIEIVNKYLSILYTLHILSIIHHYICKNVYCLYLFSE